MKNKKLRKFIIKIIPIVFLLLFIGCCIANAEDIQSYNEQYIESDNNYLGANIQAGMPKKKQKQKMTLHLNIFSVNVQYIRSESISDIKK